MSDIFNLKEVFMTPLIKIIIKHPKLMASKIFLKAMLIFPEKISKSYDSKAKESHIDYQAAISYGLSHIVNEPKKILDLCTGTGFAAFMAINYFPDALVIGVDQSEGMIELAKGKVGLMDAERIKFERRNAAKLGYKDEIFDLVITSNAPIYLKEAARVLRCGGSIIVTYSFWGDAFLNAENEIKSLLNENGLYLVDLKSIGMGVVIHGQK